MLLPVRTCVRGEPAPALDQAGRAEPLPEPPRLWWYVAATLRIGSNPMTAACSHANDLVTLMELAEDGVPEAVRYAALHALHRCLLELAAYRTPAKKDVKAGMAEFERWAHAQYQDFVALLQQLIGAHAGRARVLRRGARDGPVSVL